MLDGNRYLRIHKLPEAPLNVFPASTVNSGELKRGSYLSFEQRVGLGINAIRLTKITHPLSPLLLLREHMLKSGNKKKGEKKASFLQIRNI